MAASDIEIEYDVDEGIVIDESNLEEFNFFMSTELVPNGLITADEMLQSTGLELSEVNLLTKMILVWPRYWKAIKQLQIKCFGYVIFQSVVKNTNNRLVMQNMFQSLNYRKMMQLQIKPINLLTTTLLLHLNWPMPMVTWFS